MTRSRARILKRIVTTQLWAQHTDDLRSPSTLTRKITRGGEIWFPEFGPQRYKAPTGWAIVFSCSLLHEVPKVTRGKRYAFLPFLYDDAAAALRANNRQHLGDLSGGGGPLSKANECDALPVTAHQQEASVKGLVLDGKCGCGNPNGCGTCLSAATYQLNTPFSTRRLAHEREQTSG